MAAGEGRRLRPLTETWPKPVLPIDGRPVIATLLRELSAAGVERVTVVSGHLAEVLEGLVGDGGGFRLRVEYVRQRRARGAGRRGRGGLPGAGGRAGGVRGCGAHSPAGRERLPSSSQRTRSTGPGTSAGSPRPSNPRAWTAPWRSGRSRPPDRSAHLYVSRRTERSAGSSTTIP